MYACPKCRKVLKYATRDSLCARCIEAMSDIGGFDEDVKTMPNIRPASLLAARN